jgi:hypothetical protein
VRVQRLGLMENLLNTLGAVLAILVSLVGIVVALDQLTARARLRRTAEWSSELIKDEENSHRVELLRHIHTRAVAGLVANTLVPARYFLEGMVWILLAPSIVISTVRSEAPDMGIIFVCFIAATSIYLPLRRGIRCYAERIRIQQTYYSGKTPLLSPRLDMLGQMEGGTRREFSLAVLLSLGLILVSLALAWLTVGSLGASTWALGFLGLGLLIIGTNLVRAYARGKHNPLA